MQQLHYLHNCLALVLGFRFKGSVFVLFVLLFYRLYSKTFLSHLDIFCDRNVVLVHLKF